MDMDEIKRGLRAEIKKRENEQYFTFQCNVRQMCKDVLAKLEEQESTLASKDKEIAELEEKHKTEVKELLCLIRDKENNFNRAFDSVEKELRHQKYKRCFKMARWCISMMVFNSKYGTDKKWHLFKKWRDRWMELAEKFKEAK